MKYLRKTDAIKCPVHQAILQQACDELHEHGYFHKQSVVDALSFGAVAEAVRWDYISEFIRDELDQDLVPLAQAFWTGTKEQRAKREQVTPESRKQNPSAYVAGIGHGKRTAGYGLLSVDDHRLAIKHLSHKRSLANGVGASFRVFATELYKRRELQMELYPLLAPLDSEQGVTTEGGNHS